MIENIGGDGGIRTLSTGDIRGTEGYNRAIDVTADAHSMPPDAPELSMESSTEGKLAQMYARARKPVWSGPIGAVRHYGQWAPRSWPVSSVYFVVAERARLIKIGYAKDPWKRLSDLQVGSPEPLQMLGLIATYLPAQLEAFLHERFRATRTHGEWFLLDMPLVEWIEQNADPWDTE